MAAGGLCAAGASAGGAAAASSGAGGGSAGASSGAAVSRDRALARCGEADIPAACRAREQHPLQRGGAQEAALQVREDRRQPAGAEAGRDGVEVGAGGAVRRGPGEMAAVAEQDADGVQQCGDARGHGPAGPIRLGIVGSGRTGRGGLGVLHRVLITMSMDVVNKING